MRRNQLRKAAVKWTMTLWLMHFACIQNTRKIVIPLLRAIEIKWRKHDLALTQTKQTLENKCEMLPQQTELTLNGRATPRRFINKTQPKCYEWKWKIKRAKVKRANRWNDEVRENTHIDRKLSFTIPPANVSCNLKYMYLWWDFNRYVCERLPLNILVVCANDVKNLTAHVNIIYCKRSNSYFGLLFVQ